MVPVQPDRAGQDLQRRTSEYLQIRVWARREEAVTTAEAALAERWLLKPLSHSQWTHLKPCSTGTGGWLNVQKKIKLQAALIEPSHPDTCLEVEGDGLMSGDKFLSHHKRSKGCWMRLGGTITKIKYWNVHKRKLEPSFYSWWRKHKENTMEKNNNSCKKKEYSKEYSLAPVGAVV